jgi:hypothetical protein
MLLGGGDLYSGSLPAEMWAWNGSSWQTLAPSSGVAPIGRWGGAAAFDEDHDALLLHGGRAAGGLLEDIWRWPRGAAHEPAVRFDVGAAAAAIPWHSITGLRVRAFCGGMQGASEAGAELVGWHTGSAGQTAGRWLSLATADAPPSAPMMLTFDTEDPDEARAFIRERSGRSTFECRPGAAIDSGIGEVALDFVEARFAYDATLVLAAP